MQLGIEAVKKYDLVNTSYSEDDVIMLLKDLSSVMKELSTSEREKLIQSGVHYSEMLPQEKEPTHQYMSLYESSLIRTRFDIAMGIAIISEMMLHNCNSVPVIISLARAGTPIGVLIKHYLKLEHNIDAPHYSISIIRDKGIDKNAMEFIYRTHGESAVHDFCFVDGWTGKGVIKKQVEEAVEDLKKSDKKWSMLRDDLYVIADPANVTQLCGTHADYLIPSSCLNSTVSGLTSRTILNNYIDTEAGDFHGAVYFEKFKGIDKTNEFIEVVSKEFNKLDSVNFTTHELNEENNGMKIVNNICEHYGIKDYKKVKPGIGEATRVLLRRVPWKVLIDNNVMDKDPDIQHIITLCREKGIAIERYDLGNYKVCGIIKELSADA